LDEGALTQARLDEMQKECALIVDDAVEWAEQQPYPTADEVTKDVYYEG
jgi:TPP-dependent pyruvate/acetoin dehydrogenase alpha subunit